MKDILVLTSGGDSSGMNAFIKSLAKICKNNNVKLLASLYGYQGLIDNNIIELDYKKMSYIDNLGGSILKSSRCLDFMKPEGFNKAIENIKKLDLECVVAVGGNGSFKGARDLSNAGVNVIAIPGTVDNDLAYSDLSLGFDTACKSAIELVNITKQTMRTFDRGFIVEVMGRDCADIALYTSIITNADMCIIEETDEQKIYDEVDNVIESGRESPLIVVKEYLLDIDNLAKNLESHTGKTFRAFKVGYAQRGGEPSNTDKMFAIQLACETMKNIRNKKYGVAIGIKNDIMISEDLNVVTKQKRLYSEHLFNLYNEYFAKK